MVWGLIESVRYSLKYRGGWRGLFNHMYTNGDYPFKVGSYMGCDAFGNRYYENKVDYPYGQHRWVEPGDMHNFDSTQVPPEWHGWLTHMNDATPSLEEEFIEKLKSNIKPGTPSDAPFDHNIGYQNELYNFNGMHNQSQIRSRGYGIGNPIVGLPPNAPDAFYTQPGSPYNPAFIRKFEAAGDLDEGKGGGRPYKNDLWKKRLSKPEDEKQSTVEHRSMTPKLQAIRGRGGTVVARK